MVSGWIAVLRLFTLSNPPEEGPTAFKKVKKYRLDQDMVFKNWNLVKIDVIIKLGGK